MEEKKIEEYVNAVTVSNTFFDFVLDFRKETIESISRINEEQTKKIEDVAKIRMSPQMAKAMAMLLIRNIEAYEKDYGKIPEFKIE